MLSKEDLKQEAKEYQNISEIRNTFKEDIIEIFYAQIEFEAGNMYFHKYREALVDSMQSLRCENYKGIIYSFEFEDTYEGLDITLNFVYDGSTRNFTLKDHDFISYRTYLEDLGVPNEN